MTYYLSFDCATKTFAFILVKINMDHLFVNINELRNIIKICENKLKTDGYSDEIGKIINKIDSNTNDIIQIITCNCIDLIPGIANKDINTVERVKIVSNYTKNEIYPLISEIPKDDLNVLIEFQMSHNTQSKIVSIALLSLFSDYNLFLVNPSLKNKLNFTENGKYCYFMEKYKNSYDANKKHALYNYKEFERIFDQTTNISDKLKGHIADAFMQIFGHILFPMNIDLTSNKKKPMKHKNNK